MLIICFLTWFGNYRYNHERRKSEDSHVKLSIFSQNCWT